MKAKTLGVMQRQIEVIAHLLDRRHPILTGERREFGFAFDAKSDRP